MATGITGRELELWPHNDFDFRRLTWEELAKYRKAKLVSLASELACDVSWQSLQPSPARFLSRSICLMRLNVWSDEFALLCPRRYNYAPMSSISALQVDVGNELLEEVDRKSVV